MGSPTPFPTGVLIVGVLAKHPTPVASVDADLTRYWGAPCAISEIIPYTHSSYYFDEMGSPLFKQWVAFRLKNIDSPTSKYKLISQAIEATHTQNNKRTINLDPGLLFPHQLMLFSTKNYAHRIPIADGIYGEIELIYSQKSWQPLPWTYPDYRGVECHNFLNQLRQIAMCDFIN